MVNKVTLNYHRVFDILNDVKKSNEAERDQIKKQFIDHGRTMLFVFILDNLDLDSPLPNEITVFCENNTDKWFDFTVSYGYDNCDEDLWVGIDFGLNVTEKNVYDIFKDYMKSSQGNMWVFDTVAVMDHVYLLANEQ